MSQNKGGLDGPPLRSNWKAARYVRSASSFSLGAGARFTLSPQPQALVWFGFEKHKLGRELVGLEIHLRAEEVKHGLRGRSGHGRRPARSLRHAAVGSWPSRACIPCPHSHPSSRRCASQPCPRLLGQDAADALRRALGDFSSPAAADGATSASGRSVVECSCRSSPRARTAQPGQFCRQRNISASGAEIEAVHAGLCLKGRGGSRGRRCGRDPVTPPPGWAPEPHRYSPGTGIR